jgi:hypothetical protein
MAGGRRGGRRRAGGGRGEHKCTKGTAGGRGDGGARVWTAAASSSYG